MKNDSKSFVQSGSFKALMIVLGIIMVFGFQYMSGNSEADGMKDYYRSYTDTATAVITNIAEKGKATTANRVYTVRFQTKRNELVESSFTDNISEPIEVGNRLHVLYDPLNPASCDSKEQVQHRTSWMHYTLLSFLAK